MFGISEEELSKHLINLDNLRKQSESELKIGLKKDITSLTESVRVTNEKLIKIEKAIAENKTDAKIKRLEIKFVELMGILQRIAIEKGIVKEEKPKSATEELAESINEFKVEEAPKEDDDLRKKIRGKLGK